MSTVGLGLLDPESLEREGMVLVQFPSGALFPVHGEEVEYITERIEAYPAQNHFPNISDKQDVDRMLIQELFVYRWGIWLSMGKDYYADPINPDQLQKQIKEYSTELRQLKKLLGIDKVARDKQRGEDSVSAFITNLLHRAREFGVMREKQLGRALELFNQLQSLITFHNNCDEQERRENHVTQADVMEWIEMVAIPEYLEIDAYFRSHNQKAWIRQM